MAPDETSDDARLAAIAALDLLDTPPEEEFDSIVELAAQLCSCPVGLFSLVDRDRQWFKSRIDFPARQIELSSSVCVHALTSPDLLVIPDLTADPRTAANPLVTGHPFIRFYAGAPLRLKDGQAIGSLCVIDRLPRPAGLTDVQRRGLKALAAQVMTQIALRQSLAEQDRALHKHEVLIRTQRAMSRARGDLDAVLDALVAGVMEVVPAADGGVVGMREGEEVVYRRARGSLAAHAGLRLPLRASLAGHAVLGGAPVLCPEVREDGRVGAGMAAAMRSRSCLAVPVRRDSEVVGALELQSDRPAAFSEADLRIAELFAGAVTAGLADHAFRRQGEILQTVTDHVARAVLLMDGEGRITFANPDAERMFGWSAAELAGRNLHTTLHHSHPDGRPYPTEDCALVRSLQDGHSIRDAEDTFFRRDGAAVHVRVTSAPVVVGGEVVSAVLTVSDVTRRRIEAASRAQAQRLQQATLELGDRLRDMGDAAEVAPILGGIVARVFGVTHVGLAAVNHDAETLSIAGGWGAEGMPSLDGLHRFRDYGNYVEDLKRGDSVAVCDIAADGRTAAAAGALVALGVRALVNIPLIERGRFVSLFYVVAAEPHAWSAQELSFLRNVADRARAAIARLEAEAHQRVLNQELSHRMKNTLAVVQAIAIQTLRGVTEKEVVAAFTDRIHSLSLAHNVLLQESWAAANIRGVVAAVLGNFGHAERFDTSGPDVRLGPRAALSLSLLLHELATNAVKYGSLSREGGTVAIAWRVSPGDDGEVLTFDWCETGGPPARKPSRKGFGSRLMQMGLTGSGGAVLTYAETGFKAEMRASLASAQAT